MIKALVTVFALVSVIILMVISMALTKDIYDSTTNEKVEDPEGKLMGFIGYIISAAIVFGLYHYLFG